MNRIFKNVLGVLASTILSTFATISFAADFASAQLAAQEGRYRDVVSELTFILDNEELETQQRVVAHANRAIAFSLLNAYGLAKQDLLQALNLNPEHMLTLNQLGLLAIEVDGDYQEAADYFKKAAALDYAVSEAHLADLYRQGLGVQRNYKEALRLYSHAIENGNALALVPLARMYANGFGVKRDTKRAFELYKQAVEAGMVEGYFEIGLAYEYGRGTSPDMALALEHYYFAAMQGHAETQNILGYIYRKGKGVKRNWQEAADWYQLASDQEHADAMNRLSWLYAGCPTASICNGDVAVSLAKRAIGIEDKASYHDSLAAGYARAKNYDQAVLTLEKVIAAMDATDGRAANYRSRMNRYLKEKMMQL